MYRVEKQQQDYYNKFLNSLSKSDSTRRNDKLKQSTLIVTKIDDLIKPLEEVF